MEVTIYAQITYIIDRTILTHHGVSSKSGLSDARWCKENGIQPNTFYNWVAGFRKKGGEIPPPTGKEDFLPTPHQYVVRVDLVPAVPFVDVTPKRPVMLAESIPASSLRLELGGAKLDIPNDINPELVHQLS